MGDGRLGLGVLFRLPRFPAAAYAPGRVGAAWSLAGLAKALLTFPSSLPDTDIKIVDTTGEEF